MHSQENIETIIKLNSEYMKEWLQLLCNTDERMGLFINDYLNTKCLHDSLIRFQCYLKSTGRGQNITAKQLQECINNKDYKTLKKLLEELLLIPVSNEILSTLRQRSMLKFINKCSKYAKMGLVCISDKVMTLQARIN